MLGVLAPAARLPVIPGERHIGVKPVHHRGLRCDYRIALPSLESDLTNRGRSFCHLSDHGALNADR